MFDISFASTISDSPVIAFAIATVRYPSIPAFAQRAGEHRNGPSDFHPETGLVGLLSALVSAMPQTRVWGATISDPAAVGAMINLLSRRLRICVLWDCGSWPRWSRHSPRIHASAAKKNSTGKDDE